MHEPETEKDAQQLLQRMRKRRDLLAIFAEEIDELLRKMPLTTESEKKPDNTIGFNELKQQADSDILNVDTTQSPPLSDNTTDFNRESYEPDPNAVRNLLKYNRSRSLSFLILGVILFIIIMVIIAAIQSSK